MKCKFFLLASACLALTACENRGERQEKKTVIHEKNMETHRDGGNNRAVRSDSDTEVRNSRDRSDY